MITETSIRDLLLHCTYTLIRHHPTLAQEQHRLFRLASACRIIIIPSNMGYQEQITISFRTGQARLLTRDQQVDVRPPVSGTRLLYAEAAILLRQDTHPSTIFHEAAHLLSLGDYHCHDSTWHHKRGILHEQLSVSNGTWTTLSVSGVSRDNELVTDWCGEKLMLYLKDDSAFQKWTATPYLHHRQYQEKMTEYCLLHPSFSMETYFSDLSTNMP